MIELKINGANSQFDVVDLSQLLIFLNKDINSFAVAVNEMFIAKADYLKTPLKNGDQVEIVQPMQGG